jgi:hypothetical protein
MRIYMYSIRDVRVHSMFLGGSTVYVHCACPVCWELGTVREIHRGLHRSGRDTTTERTAQYCTRTRAQPENIKIKILEGKAACRLI